MGSIGKELLPKAALGHAHKRGWLDFKLGIALMKDRRVSILAKLASLATGLTLTAILVAIEFPLETVIGALVPFLGLALDLTFDGLEFIFLPILVASLVIRWMAPKAIVESLRR